MQSSGCVSTGSTKTPREVQARVAEGPKSQWCEQKMAGGFLCLWITSMGTHTSCWLLLPEGIWGQRVQWQLSVQPGQQRDEEQPKTPYTSKADESQTLHTILVSTSQQIHLKADKNVEDNNQDVTGDKSKPFEPGRKEGPGGAQGL